MRESAITSLMYFGKDGIQVIQNLWTRNKDEEDIPLYLRNLWIAGQDGYDFAASVYTKLKSLQHKTLALETLTRGPADKVEHWYRQAFADSDKSIRDKAKYLLTFGNKDRALAARLLKENVITDTKMRSEIESYLKQKGRF